MTIRDWIDLIKLPSEDASLHPQAVEAATPMLIYDLLRIAKDSVMNKVDQAKRNAGDKIDRYFIACVEVCKADKNECPCNPNTGCYWYKTVKSIPNYYGDYPLVSYTDTRRKIEYTPLDDLEDDRASYSSILSGDKFTLRKYVSGEHALIESDLEDLQYISMWISPTDVMDLLDYDSCGEDTEEICNVLDVEFYVEEEYKLEILQALIALIGGAFSLSRVADTRTDGDDGSKRLSDEV